MSAAALPRTEGARRARLRGVVGDWLLLGFMVLLLALFLTPTYWLVSSSLKPSNDIFVSPTRWIPTELRWLNYVEAFQLVPMARYGLNTLVVVVVAAIGTAVSASAVAYSFARLRWPGRDLFFSLLVATMMLPEVVTLVPKFILFRTVGWIDTLLPLTVPFWFGGTPFFVFLLRQFFRSLPYELDEAARMDGAGSFRILTQIMIPLAKPALATVVVFSVIANYNDFIHPLIYLNRNEWWTLSIGLRALNDTYAARWELIMASATAMMTPMIVLFLVAQRYFVQGIHLSGLAGR